MYFYLYPAGYWHNSRKVCKFVVMSISVWVKTSLSDFLKIFSTSDEQKNFEKGEAFEEYVRETMFPLEHYHLLEKTHNYQQNRKDFVWSTMKPDFKFKSKSNIKGIDDNAFYVEAKFRKGTYWNEKIAWSYPKQFKRYKAIDYKEHPVFIVLGLGEDPQKPDKVCLFHVRNSYPELYKSRIEKYEYAFLGQVVYPRTIEKVLNNQSKLN